MAEGIKLKLVEQRGAVSVWLVDGSLVRKTLDIEFTNYGQHYRFPFIPENEVWIDQEATPDELPFFITHLLVERRLMKSGVPEDRALAIANDIEHEERLRYGDLPIGRPLSPEALEAIKIRPLATLPSGVVVWLVDGRKIRSGIYPNFTEGGNDLVYAFIPQNEIWLDNDLTPKDIGFTLLHEWLERKMMSKGKNYAAAHRTASGFEEDFRAKPGLVEHLPALIEEAT